MCCIFFGLGNLRTREKKNAKMREIHMYYSLLFLFSPAADLSAPLPAPSGSAATKDKLPRKQVFPSERQVCKKFPFLPSEVDCYYYFSF